MNRSYNGDFSDFYLLHPTLLNQYQSAFYLLFTMTDQGYLDQPDLHTKAPFRSALLTYPGNLREALHQAQEDPTKTLFGVAHGIPSTFVTKVSAPEICTSRAAY